VGDSEFTKLSRARMDQIMSTGATIVLVSHDLETVKKLATKVLWLDNGSIKMFGKPELVIEKYQESQNV
jgi:ABC-type polysaccharide/polyol phosphate transport system ATPase subunit